MKHAVWSLLILGLIATATSASADTPDRVCHLVLTDALGEGRDIDLYATFAPKGGPAQQAMSVARRFNRMPHTVDASGLKLSGDTIAGKVKVTIPFDGWVPRNKKPLDVTVTINAKRGQGKLSGSYTAAYDETNVNGSLQGTDRPRAAHDEPQRISLTLENAVFGKKRKASRLQMELAVQNGKVYAVRLIPPGSITDVAMVSETDSHDVSLKDGALRGRVTGRITPQGQPDNHIEHTWEFDGLALGDRAAGEVKIKAGDRSGTGAFLGHVESITAKPADALWTITCHQAVPPYNFINVFFTSRDGKVLHGFAATPNYNNAMHEVDASALQLNGDTLSGQVVVTVLPDGWIPKDRQKSKVTLKVNATVDRGEVRGSHSGTFRDEKVNGAIEGKVESKPDLSKLAGLTLKVEDGVFHRAFLTMHFDEHGKLSESRVWNNHTSLTGTVESAAFDFTGERVRGKCKVKVSKGGVTAGEYEVEVEGKLVGTMGAGKALTQGMGKENTTTFWIALKPRE